MRQYVYKVTEVAKVTDGDTYWLRLDVGFRQSLLCHLRLDGWDTPETNSRDAVEREAGNAAEDFAAEWLRERAAAGTLWVETRKDPDSFGRWLGHVFAPLTEDQTEALGVALEAKGLAVPYPGKWRDQPREVPPGA